MCGDLLIAPGFGTCQGGGMALMDLHRETGDGIEFLTNRGSI